MSSASHAAQPTASPSSSPSAAANRASQENAPTISSSAASNSSSAGPLHDSDDDLSDAPESPVLPTFPVSFQTPPTAPLESDSDSDSDLSDAPTSPVWPGSPKAPPTPPRCTENDCPVRRAIHRHYQGPYLHNGQPPLRNDTMFGNSNPPPHVWESWWKVQAGDPSSTVEDDWNIFGFLRWHVDNPHVRV